MGEFNLSILYIIGVVSGIVGSFQLQKHLAAFYALVSSLKCLLVVSVRYWFEKKKEGGGGDNMFYFYF
jgi:hypothetical protein